MRRTPSVMLSTSTCPPLAPKWPLASQLPRSSRRSQCRTSSPQLPAPWLR
ncbi:UNVERIFIED_CONTAM: hypothetical protein GTU68_017960 [Idotea baltica]|nr:hypothetical protein [Idotea baltica]